MALNGMPLVVLVATLAVASPVLTYVLWGRMAGRTWRLPVRGGLLLTSQLCAVLLVAVLANDYGYFYTSWSEVFGTGAVTTAAPPVAVHRGTSAPVPATTSPAGVVVLGDTGWSSPAQWATRGRVLSVEVRGGSSGLAEHAYVYLPPQYGAASAHHVRLPAAEVMTGYPGHEQSLLTRMKYPDQELAALRVHRTVPMVLVMLRPAVTQSRDTECTDVPGGPQALTFFGQDVPRAISSAFWVRGDDWAVIGDSTGGYCATKIAMTHADVFRAAVSLSGYYFALHDHTTGDLWGGSSVLRDLNDPLWRLAHLPEPPIGLFVSIGRDEHGSSQSYAETMQLQRAVAAAHGPLRLTCVVLPHGGHNFGTWSALLPRAFSWLAPQLRSEPTPSFRPGW
ncbi:MAG TPA: alpha/beta hydrolase-fold protein [Actinomycetales bacterium]|nr:alpha/beta hydrolase-fold protein [Actinomycetales bacterium]